MKLSEAIRLGAMLKPQGEGNSSLFGYMDTSCALGAAADAIGLASGVCRYSWLADRWPLLRLDANCPSCSHEGRVQIMQLIYHLNDVHHWTREQIADWIEIVESAKQPSVESPVAVLAGAK